MINRFKGTSTNLTHYIKDHLTKGGALNIPSFDNYLSLITHDKVNNSKLNCPALDITLYQNKTTTIRELHNKR